MTAERVVQGNCLGPNVLKICDLELGLVGDLGHRIWGRGTAIPLPLLDRPGGGLGSAIYPGCHWAQVPQVLGRGGGLLLDPRFEPVQRLE